MLSAIPTSPLRLGAASALPAPRWAVHAAATLPHTPHCICNAASQVPTHGRGLCAASCNDDQKRMRGPLPTPGVSWHPHHATLHAQPLPRMPTWRYTPLLAGPSQGEPPHRCCTCRGRLGCPARQWVGPNVNGQVRSGTRSGQPGPPPAPRSGGALRGVAPATRPVSVLPPPPPGGRGQAAPGGDAGAQ
jgi:hypothetical protein